MNIKKTITVGTIAVAASALALDYVEVIDVSARQRYPWNGLVDIDFELDSHATEPYMMKVTVFDNVGKTNLPVKTAYTENISQKANPCMVTKDTTRIVWDAAADLPDGFKCTNVLVTCQDTRAIEDDKRYMIIDLSGGSSASSYPVSYMSAPPAGGWTDEYKTTKLVLRKIDAGTFMMGSPDDEIGRKTNEDYHSVTLTEDYYIGVFETTEAQYLLVKGSGSSTKKPVLVNYAGTRGADLKNYLEPWQGKSEYCWPDSIDVDVNSFVGLLRSRTPIKTFDLPTEAQWELASKGKCIKSVNVGLDCSSASVNTVGRNINNRSDGMGDASSTTTTYVGLYMPNAFGLYDMLGNAAEWCVDAYRSNLGTSAVTNPKGGTANVESYNKAWIYRVIKGGGVIGGGGQYLGIWYFGTLCGNVYNNSFMPYDASRSASRATTVTGHGSSGQDTGESTASIKCGFRVMCYAE